MQMNVSWIKQQNWLSSADGAVRNNFVVHETSVPLRVYKNRLRFSLSVTLEEHLRLLSPPSYKMEASKHDLDLRLNQNIRRGVRSPLAPGLWMSSRNGSRL